MEKQKLHLNTHYVLRLVKYLLPNCYSNTYYYISMQAARRDTIQILHVLSLGCSRFKRAILSIYPYTQYSILKCCFTQAQPGALQNTNIIEK